MEKCTIHEWEVLKVQFPPWALNLMIKVLLNNFIRLFKTYVKYWRTCNTVIQKIIVRKFLYHKKYYFIVQASSNQWCISLVINTQAKEENTDLKICVYICGQWHICKLALPITEEKMDSVAEKINHSCGKTLIWFSITCHMQKSILFSLNIYLEHN